MKRFVVMGAWGLIASVGGIAGFEGLAFGHTPAPISPTYRPSSDAGGSIGPTNISGEATRHRFAECPIGRHLISGDRSPSRACPMFVAELATAMGES